LLWFCLSYFYIQIKSFLNISSNYNIWIDFYRVRLSQLLLNILTGSKIPSSWLLSCLICIESLLLLIISSNMSLCVELELVALCGLRKLVLIGTRMWGDCSSSFRSGDFVLYYFCFLLFFTLELLLLKQDSSISNSSSSASCLDRLMMCSDKLSSVKLL
jgi:hypothetical protein